MADYNSSLPVRTEIDADERLQSKIVDFANPTNGATVADDLLWVKSHLNDEDGNPFTEGNPLPVYIAEHPADEINDYDLASAVAKDASANHDYTVTAAKVFKQLAVHCAASGKSRFELQIETGAATGIFNTAMVKFNSTAQPNVEFMFKPTIATGVIIRVAKTNLDNQAQDIYSQIIGIEV